MHTTAEDRERPDQLIELIRFGLADLSARNAHFEFEELCRHLARARICTNILPATGPVGVGGDQGRDFETFRSYLRDELGEHGGFLGLVSDGALAFACSTQKEDAVGKIRSDIQKIMESGQPVQGIYAFTTADIPVAKRHALIDEVKTEWGVSLEILDARAIGEQLADPGTYWITDRYLSLPSGFEPVPALSADDPPEWYVELRNEWRGLDNPLPTLGDALDIREGLRRATFHHDARVDLPFWLDLAKALVVDAAPEYVKQRARYDIAVATLRGTGTLRPVDGLVREMFAAASEDDHPMRLLDASVLLMFVSEACTRGVTDFSAEEVKATNRQLHDRVTSLLQASSSRMSRAGLLYVAGHLSLQPDLTQLDIDAVGHGADIDVADLVDQGGHFDPPPLEIEDGTALPMVDRSGGMGAWLKLAGMLEDVPMFEVESWGRILVVMTPLLSDEPDWSTLVDAVDQAVAKVAGGSASASLCRDRALALMNQERHVDAIGELHKAKIGWWSGDMVRGSLLAMLLLARSYSELGMQYAAKQHSLGVASIAMNLDSEDLANLVPAAVFIAADADYRAGAWCGASELYEAGLLLHSHLVEHGLDLEHPAVQAAVFHLTVIIDAAGALAGPLRPLLLRMAENIGVDDVVEAILAEAPERSPEDWHRKALSQGIGPPFLDAGPTRTIRFAALGTGWEIECSNTVDAVRAAERLAAAAQILLVELSRHDLALVPTSVHVSLDVAADASGFKIVNEHDNERRSWTVALSPIALSDPPELDSLGVELLVTLLTVLSDASLLPEEDFEQIVESAFKDGIAHKLSAGRPYDELAAIVSDDRFDETARRELTSNSDLGFMFAPPPELAWQSGPGPTFDENTARQLLASRYENLRGCMDQTLAGLRNDESFRSVVSQLRKRGWLDWHILTAIFNITFNYRLAPTPDLDWREAVETDDTEPAPPALFTLESMELARQLSMMSLVKHWGLESRQLTPNTDAIEVFLSRRYGYWDDDVDHTDPFPAFSGE